MRLLVSTISISLLVTWGGPTFGQNFRVEKSLVPAAHGMYLNSTGKIWLTDTFKNLDRSSFIYDLFGKKINGLPSGVGIAGISKHPLRDEYLFSDTMGSKIFRVNAAGKRAGTFDIEGPWNARWTPSGKSILAVTHAGSIIRVEEDGSMSELVSGLDAPFDIAPVSENGFWVSEQGTESPGKVCLFLQSLNSGKYKKVSCNKGRELDNPEGLWPLKDGSVAAVDTELGTLVKIRPDGTTILLSVGLGIPILVQVLEGGNWVVYSNQSSGGPALLFGNSQELVQ
jgi:hypothetical protein